MRIIDFHVHPFMSADDYLSDYPEVFSRPDLDMLVEDMNHADISCFCGTVVSQRYAGKRIIFLTPLRREGDLHIGGNPIKFSACKETERDEYAKPLKAYVDVIVEKGKEHGLEVYNLYETLSINPNLEEDKKCYAPDGLHLNDAGHKLLAEYIKNIL